MFFSTSEKLKNQNRLFLYDKKNLRAIICLPFSRFSGSEKNVRVTSRGLYNSPWISEVVYISVSFLAVTSSPLNI